MVSKAQRNTVCSMLVDFCIALEKLGISAFRFDFSGNGYIP
ncbi:hypothetical protein Hdeb2414_s0027g00696601 [Helianthus debilis subsp. tardiflorus]